MKASVPFFSLCGLLLATPLCAQLPAFQKAIVLQDTIPANLLRHIGTSDDGVIVRVEQDTLLTLAKLDVNGDLLWSYAYPSSIADDDWDVKTMVATNDGGAVVILDIWSSDDTEPTWMISLARIDAGGSVIWSKRYSFYDLGMLTYIYPRIVANDAGEFFVSVADMLTLTPPRIMKLSGSGDLLWCVDFEHWGGNWPNILYPSPDGGCVVVDWYPFGPGAGPMPIARFDAAGNMLWAKEIQMINGTWTVEGNTALVASTGDVYVQGDQHTTDHFGYLLKLNPGGELVWYKLYGEGSYGHAGQQMYELPSGDLLCTGAGRTNVFDTNGEHLSRTARAFDTYVYGNLSYALTAASTQLPSDDFITGGNWTKTDDFFDFTWYTPVIMRDPLDLTGSCGWTETIEPTVQDTIVPAAFINITDITASNTHTVGVADTTAVQIPVPLTLVDFCSLLTVEDQLAQPPVLDVFPTLAAPGTSITVRTTATRATIELRDGLGRLIRHPVDMQGAFQLDTHGLDAGMYVLQAREPSGRALAAVQVILQ